VFDRNAVLADDFLARELSKYHIRPAAIDKVLSLAPDEEWYPTLQELAEMNLVLFVYDDEAGDYLRIRDYCVAHVEKCE